MLRMGSITAWGNVTRSTSQGSFERGDVLGRHVARLPLRNVTGGSDHADLISHVVVEIHSRAPA